MFSFPVTESCRNIQAMRSRFAWSDLPKELLEIIANSLLTREDVCRFRAVCKSWRSSIPPFQKPISLPLEVPYPTPSYHRHPNIAILTESTIYHVQPFPSPNSQASTSTSTWANWASWGWLVKVEEMEARLFRVLGSISCQPSYRFPTFPKSINLLDFQVSELAKAYSLHFPKNGGTCKVVFSSRPDDCPSLMTICAGLLFHQKIGDDKWTLIDDIVSQLCYEDVILYNNRFCAVDEDGRTLVIDSTLKVIEIASPLKNEKNGHDKILVESVGELLLVERLCKKPYIKVFKLKVKEKEWVEVKSLDDRIMFLGGDCSFCVAAKDFGNECKGNCIFFTYPRFTVFNLEDSSLLSLHKHPGYNNFFYPPPSDHRKKSVEKSSKKPGPCVYCP
ncbi:F-box protein SKIP23-like [Ziziphus jujuba]|uniref:F-box protein SKIP23-like n=1 Tax=Ziziphus jujuba TaxID=326968 RepID=A0ABM3ITY4_ZIZJJ|nr:F-box protein SKIP23-like [Ziziphus jujuba]